jgi:hypothetical protein
VIEQNHKLARVFQLDGLICSKDKTVQNIGVNLGALIIQEVQSVSLADIVDSDFSMEKINQAILKYVLNSHNDLW